MKANLRLGITIAITIAITIGNQHPCSCCCRCHTSEGPASDAEPNRTEPSRATTRLKNAGRTAPKQDNKSSEPNRTELINFRRIRNRNESSRTDSFLQITFQRLILHLWTRISFLVGGPQRSWRGSNSSSSISSSSSSRWASKKLNK